MQPVIGYFINLLAKLKDLGWEKSIMTKNNLFKLFELLGGITRHDLYTDGTIINKVYKNM